MNWRPWVGWLVVAIAFALGLMVDAIGPDQRVNILAFPLLALLAWNLIVYLLLIGSSLFSIAAPAGFETGPVAARCGSSRARCHSRIAGEYEHTAD
jgi:hypothetical protein